MMLFVNTEVTEKTSIDFVDRNLLLRKAEHCRETTDAFKELINEVPGYKYFWKVIIFKKDLTGATEIAGFINESIAKAYIDNVIKKNPNWDDSKLYAQAIMYELPPWTCTDELLSKRIELLLNRD